MKKSTMRIFLLIIIFFSTCLKVQAGLLMSQTIRAECDCEVLDKSGNTIKKTKDVSIDFKFIGSTLLSISCKDFNFHIVFDGKLYYEYNKFDDSKTKRGNPYTTHLFSYGMANCATLTYCRAIAERTVTPFLVILPSGHQYKYIFDIHFVKNYNQNEWETIQIPYLEKLSEDLIYKKLEAWRAKEGPVDF